MAIRIAAVKRMFVGFERRGMTRTPYLPSTIDGTTTKHRKGYIDFRGPLSDTEPAQARTIIGAALKNRTDYIIRISLYEDIAMPKASFMVDAILYKRPVNDVQMPVHEEQSAIGPELIFPIYLKGKKPVSYYLEQMPPKEAINLLASQDKAFLRMIKQFNSCVGRV